MVDYGASINVMPLSAAKKINSQWSKIDAQIIKLDRICVPTIGEIKDVIIESSSDIWVHQCINTIIVDIPKAYGVFLRRD